MEQYGGKVIDWRFFLPSHTGVSSVDQASQEASGTGLRLLLPASHVYINGANCERRGTDAGGSCGRQLPKAAAAERDRARIPMVRGTVRAGSLAQEEHNERLEKIESGVIGLAVGDALGVPVEFSSREERQRDPVAEMRGYGAHNQPADTWSDGTSMALCLMESLTRVELRGHHGQLRQMELGRVFTVGDICFDIGGTTLRAI